MVVARAKASRHFHAQMTIWTGANPVATHQTDKNRKILLSFGRLNGRPISFETKSGLHNSAPAQNYVQTAPLNFVQFVYLTFLINFAIIVLTKGKENRICIHGKFRIGSKQIITLL
jgi:hypothetical protein